jgi:RhtB (resistance to homoserine/threonine) family protein
MFFAYFPTISLVIGIATMMAISPGQDFAMITRNSLLYSRRAGVIGALGIFAAIWLHVAYSLAGIAVLIDQSPLLYNLIKYAGAIYLLFLGARLLLAKKAQDTQQKSSESISISDRCAFRAGFLSNALNPKTTLFFLTIFTQIVTPETPYSIQFVFGLIIALAHLLWFSLVALFFSSAALAIQIKSIRVWIERVMGLCLCLFAAKLIV